MSTPIIEVTGTGAILNFLSFQENSQYTIHCMHNYHSNLIIIQINFISLVEYIHRSTDKYVTVIRLPQTILRHRCPYQVGEATASEVT